MAALSSSTTAKFLREIFKETSPIQVEPDGLSALTEKVLDLLRGQQLVRLESNHYFREEEKRGLICQFSIEDPTKGPYQWNLNTFDVRLDENNQLIVTTHPHQVARVSDLCEISALVTACQDRMMRRKGQQSKDQKVKKLKNQAVIARVKELAVEEKFDFYTEANDRFLKLCVKISERECAELQIPYKNFEAVVPLVRDAIQTLRSFHQKGLRLGMRHLGPGWRYDWVRHEDLA